MVIELSPAADPHVAIAISPGGVEQSDVRPDRGQQDDRIVASANGLSIDPPVVAMRPDVPADDAPQGHEGDPLLGRLQSGVDRRARRVPHRDRAAPDGLGTAAPGPYSPRVTAAASSAATQPAPISMSAWMPPGGTAISRSSRTPRRISARIAAIAQPQ